MALAAIQEDRRQPAQNQPPSVEVYGAVSAAISERLPMEGIAVALRSIVTIPHPRVRDMVELMACTCEFRPRRSALTNPPLRITRGGQPTSTSTAPASTTSPTAQWTA